MDRDIYREVSRKTRKFDRSRRYRAAIENPKKKFFKEEKQYEIKVNKIDTKPNNKEAC